MKKKILAIVTILSLAVASTAFARGYGHGGHGGYSHGYRHSHHGHDGLGIALGVAGGLILGSVLLAPPPPPPREIVYVPQPPPVYHQPRVCFEERLVSGEWQVNRYDGRQIWVPFQYPVTRQVRIPCY